MKIFVKEIIIIIQFILGDFLERLSQEGCSRARVLDLACGKGGDLRKWRIGNIAQIVMTGHFSNYI
jgi:hypothetical protein